MKPTVKGESLPDNDGASDIPGYSLLKAYIVTQDSLNGDLKGSKFKIGDVINIYDKMKDAPKEEPKTDAPKETGKEEPKADAPKETGNEAPKVSSITTNG